MPINAQLGNISYVLCAIVGGVLAFNHFAGPVSYTHLDVYKRQLPPEYSVYGFILCSLRICFTMESPIPVPRTSSSFSKRLYGLDVYKRQV